MEPLSIEAIFAISVVLLCLATLVITRISADVVFFGGLTLYLVFGVVSPEQALSGFANPGLLTIAALYVVAAGLRETGALTWVTKQMFGRDNKLPVAQVRLMLPVTLFSAFMNNTPVVATFLPAVIDWAKKYQVSVSRLLIPLSYAAIFGGMCTLIGTSTNLVVNGLLLSETGSGMGFFEIAWLGVPCAIIGTVYVILTSRWLLPERVPPMAGLQDPREYTVEMLVEEQSPLESLTVEEAGLRHLPGLYLAEIDRDGQIIAAVGPDEKLKGGDRLVFAGITESIVDLQKIKGLKPATNQVFKLEGHRAHRSMIEAVVSGNSPIVSKTIKDSRFRNLYNAVVIAVAREGKRINRKIGDIEIHAGDTLLLEADTNFAHRMSNSRDFLLVRPIEGSPVPRYERSWAAWLILFIVVGSAVLEIFDVMTAALVGAAGMVVTRCCTATVARRSVDLRVVGVIAAAFGIGKGLDVSGAASYLAGGLLQLAGDNPMTMLIMVYVGTVLLTEMITNNAAAVLMFPIAFAATHAEGIAFMPFAMAIAFAASASFATPIGYQTNLMVYGPGGYRFTDYTKFGLPLNIILGITAILLIPNIWSF
ncbi:MAG: SLC13 family permease [Gammaproteobacteria bacterium]